MSPDLQPHDAIAPLLEGISKMDHVNGVLLLSFRGEILFCETQPTREVDLANWEGWHSLLASLCGIRETELIGEAGNLYIRRTPLGYLLISLGGETTMKMVRVHCDTLIPSLKEYADDLDGSALDNEGMVNPDVDALPPKGQDFDATPHKDS
jgi:hypothetical protein